MNILLIGTCDTKAEELLFMRDCLLAQGGQAVFMDVGVLGTPSFAVDVTNAQVAAAAHTNLAEIIAFGDENAAMTKMAEGAVTIALDLYAQGKIQGVLALGGTMGTDLALDVTAALPLGMPKFLVTTVAYSHLVPPERLAPDLMMILWAGGLYGLNSICRSILSQAAGAVLGACKATSAISTPVRAEPVEAHQASLSKRPKVAISSLGKSCVDYMTRLTPALIERGFEPVVFHSTGMGGAAMEALIARGEFVAVFDFLLQEIGNDLHGSVVSAGPKRLHAAIKHGVPLLVAPGCLDMIDVQSWKPLDSALADRPYHAHNRLIGSYLTTPEERAAIAFDVCKRLEQATAPTAFFLPLRGIHAWDVEGAPLRDEAGQAALVEALRQGMPAKIALHEVDAHINEVAFTDAALRMFDEWVACGFIAETWVLNMATF